MAFDTSTKEPYGALWRDGLNPEVSSWDDVVLQGETIEISHNVSNVADYKKHSKGDKHQNEQCHNGQCGGSSGPQNFFMKLAVNRDPPKHNRFHTHRRPNQHYQKHFCQGQSGNQNTSKPFSKGPALSEKEQVELVASGKCFNCGKTGHFS